MPGTGDVNEPSGPGAAKLFKTQRQSAGQTEKRSEFAIRKRCSDGMAESNKRDPSPEPFGIYFFARHD